ncbi:MAG: hypothetical protein E7488_07845 [Ruminococcaceae bacterium]|nr:hypothetical protein [Oscillospiraceae bacterium]
MQKYTEVQPVSKRDTVSENTARKKIIRMQLISLFLYALLFADVALAVCTIIYGWHIDIFTKASITLLVLFLISNLFFFDCPYCHKYLLGGNHPVIPDKCPRCKNDIKKHMLLVRKK